MPRQPRKKSSTGIYHIMLRGINKQEIFHDDEDHFAFLKTIERYKTKNGFGIYGWCLMGNHIHLLLKEVVEDISNIIKRIGVSYAWHYNWKYNHTGHLFQDRFRSEEIENDEYLLTVIRYIHQNPVKAGIVRKPRDWQWSSCNAYYGKQDCAEGLVDKKQILSMFSKEEKLAVKKFIEFNEQDNEENCLDELACKRKTDEEARIDIKKIIGEKKLVDIMKLPKIERDEIFIQVKGIEGISQRQAARVLGISANLIFKA